MDGNNSNPWKKTIEEKQNLSISHRCGWCVSSIRDAGHFKSHSKKIENIGFQQSPSRSRRVQFPIILCAQLQRGGRSGQFVLKFDVSVA